MFHYRIDVKTSDPGQHRADYRQYLHPVALGEDVAKMIGRAGIRSIKVTKITQATYQRSVRGGE